jgi:hypothetical protein
MPHHVGGPPIIGMDDEINWRYGSAPRPPHISLQVTGEWRRGQFEPYKTRAVCTCIQLPCTCRVRRY